MSTPPALRHPSAQPVRLRRPAVRGLLLVAAVLAAHVWLVAQWADGGRRPGSGHGPAPRPMLLVPSQAVAAAPRLAAAALAPAALPPALPAPNLAIPAAQRPAPDVPATDGPRALDAREARPGDDLPLLPALALRPAAAASQAALELDPEAESGVPPPPAEGVPPPVYPTRMPLPVLLRYQVVAAPAGASAGATPAGASPATATSTAPGGEARLQFRHDGQRYTLQFDAQAAGRPLIEQRSVGGFDGAGLAPERFTDRRRGRGAQAANFRRDAGRIGFSGPRIDYPLLPGTQDRLSVLAQLAAISAAAASGESTGAAPARLQMLVADARGWAEVWDWQFDGQETVDTPLGALTLAHWRREPARPEGLRVEVWLDAARGHWPARLRTTLLRNGQVMDLRLAAEPAAPP